MSQSWWQRHSSRRLVKLRQTEMLFRRFRVSKTREKLPNKIGMHGWRDTSNTSRRLTKRPPTTAKKLKSSAPKSQIGCWKKTKHAGWTASRSDATSSRGWRNQATSFAKRCPLNRTSFWKWSSRKEASDAASSTWNTWLWPATCKSEDCTQVSAVCTSSKSQVGFPRSSPFQMKTKAKRLTLSKNGSR